MTGVAMNFVDTGRSDVFIVKVKKQDYSDRKNAFYEMRAVVPLNVVKGLGLKELDYVIVTAKRAEWFHVVDWLADPIAFDKLPQDIKQKIIESGLPYPKDPDQNKLDEVSQE